MASHTRRSGIRRLDVHRIIGMLRLLRVNRLFHLSAERSDLVELLNRHLMALQRCLDDLGCMLLPLSQLLKALCILLLLLQQLLIVLTSLLGLLYELLNKLLCLLKRWIERLIELQVKYLLCFEQRLLRCHITPHNILHTHGLTKFRMRDVICSGILCKGGPRWIRK